MLLRRRQGELRLNGTPADYRWTASDLTVDGLELALPPRQRWEGIYGQLSGNASAFPTMDGESTEQHASIHQRPSSWRRRVTTKLAALR